MGALAGSPLDRLLAVRAPGCHGCLSLLRLRLDQLGPLCGSTNLLDQGGRIGCLAKHHLIESLLFAELLFKGRFL